MENESTVVKGTIGNNRVARVLLIAGIALILVSFLVASYVYHNLESYEYFGFGYGGWYYWCVIYDFSFLSFFFGEFFNFSCYYGYLIILGIIAVVVGFIMKSNTEKCEITVTDNRVYGKLPHGKEVDIPLNQITGLHTCSFNGVSIASIGAVNDFHCIENHEEVIKAISYLLANPQQSPTHSQGVNIASTGSSDADQLKKYKDLFDAGVITQEEFDSKKTQLLGL